MHAWLSHAYGLNMGAQDSVVKWMLVYSANCEGMWVGILEVGGAHVLASFFKCNPFGYF